YQLGGLGQLENDLFDIYKDRKEGIQTLATRATHIGELKTHYIATHNKVISLIQQTSYPASGRKKFARIVTLLTSRGLVCLDQFQCAQQSSGGIFNPAAYNREQLVCDMGKPTNILRSVHHFAKLNNSQGHFSW
ncbi:MAG TPA: hypothetical protein VK152_02975, partial [Paludibacter sp.]|nr:hypothetical protein [Paludibacter sp.]